jgi:hypothetical protein
MLIPGSLQASKNKDNLTARQGWYFSVLHRVGNFRSGSSHRSDRRYAAASFQLLGGLVPPNSTNLRATDFGDSDKYATMINNKSREKPFSLLTLTCY